jgi:hypothetical protein
MSSRWTHQTNIIGVNDSNGCLATAPVKVKQIDQAISQYVQSLEFHDFDGLKKFLEVRKEGIEKGDPTTLDEVQERFLTVVSSIVKDRGLFPSASSSCTL